VPLSSFGSLTLASGKLALTRFNSVPSVGYTMPFEPQTDRVLVFDADLSGECAAACVYVVIASPCLGSVTLRCGV
jgi:hypothetical protein